MLKLNKKSCLNYKIHLVIFSGCFDLVGFHLFERGYEENAASSQNMVYVNSHIYPHLNFNLLVSHWWRTDLCSSLKEKIC